MKSEIEIIKAHDLFVAYILGEVVPPPCSIVDQQKFETQLVAAADVLCWILDHEHNKRFDAKIAALSINVAMVPLNRPGCEAG